MLNGLGKYMTFPINKHFIGSMQFMNSSLDASVNKLSHNGFKHFSHEFSDNLLGLVKQKGVYPYEYMDSFKKFSYKQLSDRPKFFSFLKDECISEKGYLHPVDKWIVSKRNTLGDYHDLYLKTDILLLADVFQKFISTRLEYYGLGTCHYFSSPGLSCDAMLKMTEIELELISDINVYLFVEKGMSECTSYIAKTFSKAIDK